MEKETSAQLELFAQAQGPGARNAYPNNLFLARIRAHEKAILIIMGIAVICIISFSLGMEKGKSIAVSKPAVIPVEARPVIRQEKVQDNRLIRQENVTIKETAPQEGDYFVIQLASFKNKSLAQKEASDLKKRGFTSVIVSKGPYTVLCVGNFSDRQKALSQLPELKKQYKDCYVRRF